MRSDGGRAVYTPRSCSDELRLVDQRAAVGGSRTFRPRARAQPNESANRVSGTGECIGSERRFEAEARDRHRADGVVLATKGVATRRDGFVVEGRVHYFRNSGQPRTFVAE